MVNTRNVSAALRLGGGVVGTKHKKYKCPVWIGELWTARQRQMHPVHYTVSYRASFKPELPEFFIRQYLGEKRNAVVFDPFGGRGTTVLQANLMGHRGIHNDLNPLAHFIAAARRVIPTPAALIERLEKLDLDAGPEPDGEDRERLGPFFHARTLREINALRHCLMPVAFDLNGDPELRYIGLTALSRLHGHSDGFLSAYSFPQISILPEAQRRNNRNRGQKPEYRALKPRIIRKLRADLAEGLPSHYHRMAARNRYTISDACELGSLRGGTVDLIVTSPPFLDKVNYVQDNWMRAWFLGVEQQVAGSGLMMDSDPGRWVNFMTRALTAMGRVLRKGGRAVIEVGEVSSRGNPALLLEELMLEQLPLVCPGGRLEAEALFINTQRFTKLANCWDVTNNSRGTNTNRCLVLRKR